MTECAGRIQPEEAVEAGVVEAEAEVKAGWISAVEGADAGLADPVVETSVSGDRGR